MRKRRGGDGRGGGGTPGPAASAAPRCYPLWDTGSVSRERTITLLFSDIEGSTRLWETDPEAMSGALRRHEVLLSTAIEQVGGVVFKTVGDAFCAVFEAAPIAVGAAVEIQRLLTSEDWPEGFAIRVRVGLHSGVCEHRGGDYFGPAVNRVARLQAIAHGGQVVVSGSTAALLHGHLSDGVELLDLGEHRLKDLQQPERVHQVLASGLGRSFPPLRSLGNPQLQHNLPERISSFVGRDSELADVRDLLKQGRLVTLTGAGGVGKTRLALQAAAELLDGTGDGVWFIDLAPLVDEELVAVTVASVLSVHEQAGRPAIQTLLAALSDRDLLLVMDNCEHLIHEVARVAKALLEQCPRVAILATSRERLSISGERVYRVPSLSTPDGDCDLDLLHSSEAVLLFVERAREQRPSLAIDDTTIADVASVCRRLDGIPLAIELAAARVGSMTVRALRERLGRHFRLLTSGDRDALPRQRTLEALIGWSYELLSAVEQRFLQRMSVFAGGFGLEAAEPVSATPDLADEIPIDLLGALVDKSLVQIDESSDGFRYRLLESVRDYAALKLREHDPAEVPQLSAAHRDYFLRYAETAVPYLKGREQIEWRSRLEAEQDNMRAALAYCLEGPDPEPGLRLAAALVWWWRMGGYLVEGVTALSAQLDRPGAHEPTPARGYALAAAAYLLAHVDPAACATRAEEAIQIARLRDDGYLAGDGLLSMGVASEHLGRSQEALSLIDQALVIARRIDDPHFTARCLAERLLRDPDGPNSATARETLRLCQEVGYRRLTLSALGNIGYLDLATRNSRAARLHFQGALAAAQELDLPREIVVAKLNVGLTAYLDGDEVSSMQTFQDAARRARVQSDRPLIAYALLGAALGADACGQPTIACKLHGAADSVFDQLQFSPEEVESKLREESLIRLRSACGDDRFEALCETGRTLSIGGAVDLAISTEVLGERVAL